MIDASDCGCEIDEVSVRAIFTTFQDGQVKMEIKEDKEKGITEILDGGLSRTLVTNFR